MGESHPSGDNAAWFSSITHPSERPGKEMLNSLGDAGQCHRGTTKINQERGATFEWQGGGAVNSAEFEAQRKARPGPTTSRRRVAAALLCGMVGLAMIWAEGPTFADDPALAVGNVLFGFGFAITAAFLADQPEQRGNAVLLALASIAFLVDESTQHDLGAWSSPMAFAGPFVQVLVGALLLRYPQARFDAVNRIFIVINAAVAAVLGLALAATYPLGYPYAANTVMSPGFEAVLTARSAWWAVGSTTFLVLLGRRWVHLPALERRILSPIMFGAAFGAIVLALALAQDWMPRPLAELLGLARAWVAVAISLSFVVSAVLLRLSVAEVATLASRLAGPVSVASVEEALRDALSDPSLRVYYWLPAESEFVGGDGSTLPSPLPVGRTAETVNRDKDTPLAVITADDALGRHRLLLHTAAAVSRLALENTRLEAELRYQLAETQQARSRLLRAGMEQRRQIERELHDGAQQHFLAVALRLAAVETHTSDAATIEGLLAARAELQAALAELRELAHGIYPATLSENGLGPALRSVTSRLPMACVMQVDERRWPSDTESAAYFTACEAIANAAKYADAKNLWVDVAQESGQLLVRVRDDGRGSPELNASDSLPGLRERLAALGGELVVVSSAGGTTVTARIPAV